jgi:hypothetical protein
MEVGSETRLESGAHLTIAGQLISQYYLSSLLPKRDDWKNAPDDIRALRIQTLYEQVRPILTKNKAATKGSNEQAVRDLLLNPIFEILGLPWSPAVHHFGKQLDYALYENRESFERAQSLITAGKEIEALRMSCAVAEAERWGKEFGDKPKKSDLSAGSHSPNHKRLEGYSCSRGRFGHRQPRGIRWRQLRVEENLTIP